MERLTDNWQNKQDGQVELVVHSLKLDFHESPKIVRSRVHLVLTLATPSKMTAGTMPPVPIPSQVVSTRSESSDYCRLTYLAVSIFVHSSVSTNHLLMIGVPIQFL